MPRRNSTVAPATVPIRWQTHAMSELDMNEAEREAFIAGLHVGVLAAEHPGHGPLALPIWYVWEDGAVVMRIGTDSLKAKLLRAAGRATLTVQEEAPPYKYVSETIVGRSFGMSTPSKRGIQNSYVPSMGHGEFANSEQSSDPGISSTRRRPPARGPAARFILGAVYGGGCCKPRRPRRDGARSCNSHKLASRWRGLSCWDPNSTLIRFNLKRLSIRLLGKRVQVPVIMLF